MSYELIFYETQSGRAPALEFLRSQPKPVRAEGGWLLEQLRRHGDSLGRPAAAFLEDGIHELRWQIELRGSMREKQRRGVPLKEWLDEELKDPEFKRYYDESSVKWHVAMQIVEARQKANMTQGELARQIGDRQQNVSRIESGEQNVTVGTLDKIAKAVGGQLVVKIVEAKTGILSRGDRAGALKVSDRKKRYKIKR